MHRKGFALALTLWIVAIMSLVSVLYLSYGKKVIEKTKQLNQKLNVTLEVESTIELLKFYIMTGDFRENSIKNNLFYLIFPKLSNELYIDGRNIVWENKIIVLHDTAGLIGTNDFKAIASSLHLSKEKKVIIQDSMNDWLDENTAVLLNGAEDSFYKKDNYSARNENYFSSIEELFLIRGLVDQPINQKNNLKSKLIMSNYLLRNILTMDINILGKIYDMPQIEIEQLLKAKMEGKDSLLRTFYQFKAEAFNVEGTGTSPSRIIQMTVTATNENAKETVTLLISFRPNIRTAFEVLEYSN